MFRKGSRASDAILELSNKLKLAEKAVLMQEKTISTLTGENKQLLSQLCVLREQYAALALKLNKLSDDQPRIVTDGLLARQRIAKLSQENTELKQENSALSLKLKKQAEIIHEFAVFRLDSLAEKRERKRSARVMRDAFRSWFSTLQTADSTDHSVLSLDCKQAKVLDWIKTFDEELADLHSSIAKMESQYAVEDKAREEVKLLTQQLNELDKRRLSQIKEIEVLASAGVE